MTHFAPPIAKLAATLRADIEKAVCKFPQRHRNLSGTDLRRAIIKVAVLADRAWRDSSNTPHWVSELKWAMDEFKLAMQLCKDVEAFASFPAFEQLARDMVKLGQQVGGWHKQQHPQSQNAPAGSRAQRATTLSTRPTSQYEVNP
jgi:hypothetical protein